MAEPTPTPTAAPAPAPSSDLAWRLGVGSTLALGAVLLAWALTADIQKVTHGFFSDGATYYMLAHSLADDFDFEYDRGDLVRVWREYPGGPEGLFLKRGRGGHIYFAKAFIFPFFAAPFVWAFGTNGFFVLHAILMTICFACAYAFLVARSAPVPALIYTTAFLLVSVAPVYMVQFMPDFFNLALVLIAYFFWCYKEAAAESTTVCLGRWRKRWVISPRSDIVAAALLGIATFSKPTIAPLIAPPLVLFLVRRQWLRAIGAGAVFAAVVLGLFGWNMAVTGEWNYQGGERKTFYATEGQPLGGWPLLTEKHTFETTGLARTTNRVPVEVLTGRDAFFEVFRRNLGYFFIGRYAGLVPYFFPAAASIVLFLATRGRRRLWQWLTLAGGLGAGLFLILYMPFTYSGGGGPVGNRYYLGVYPVFLFITPPLARLTSGVVTMAVSALFTAPLISNPFYVSFNPAEHTKTGLFRLLPAELTLLNDLPVNVYASRVKQPLGGNPPLQAYFLDDNAYNREGNGFWVRGGSRTQVLLRAPVVTETGSQGDVIKPLTVPRVDVALENGPIANRVMVDTGEQKQVVDLAPNDRRSITLAMPRGLPYKAFPEWPTNYVYSLSIESESGFIPMFTIGSGDNRLLGAFVRITPVYQ